MTKRYSLAVLRFAVLVACGVSAALLLYYLAPSEGAFCGAQAGCDAVRKSKLATAITPWFVPAAGLGFYVLLYWFTFQPGLWRLARGAAILGGLGAVGLLGYQALVVHQFCWLCVSVDAAAIVAGVAAFLVEDPTKGASWDRLRGWAWTALLVLAVNTPNLWTKVRDGDKLPAILEQMMPAGQLTVVEFLDFQCPHCRNLHFVMQSELAMLGLPVKVVRVHMPLSFHFFAEKAARAALCAGEQGKAEAMTSLLFELPLQDGVWFEHATALKLDDAKFRECLFSERMGAELQRHRELFEAVGGRVLPLTYIGRQSLVGSAGIPVVDELFHRELRPWWAKWSANGFAALIGVCALALCAAGFRRRDDAPVASAPSSS